MLKPILFLFFVAAWLTHVTTCLINGAIGLLLLGAIAFPIGIVHGIMIWAGLAG